MQILNCLRSSLFNNDYSKFKRACAAQSDLEFAKKMFSVKSQSAHLLLNTLKKDSPEYKAESLKSQQYDIFLNEINGVTNAYKKAISVS